MTILIARGALVTCPAIFLHAVHQATRMLEVGRACHRRSFRPPVLELVHALILCSRNSAHRQCQISYQRFFRFGETSNYFVVNLDILGNALPVPAGVTMIARRVRAEPIARFDVFRWSLLCSSTCSDTQVLATSRSRAT